MHMTTLSRVINGEAPVAPDCDDDPQALSAACKEWLLETGDEDDVSTQKINSNRKKFKKHLICEYEQWERLNGVALSEIYDSCAQSIQLSVGKKKRAAEVWKQLENSFAISSFALAEQQIWKLQELSYLSCKHLLTSLPPWKSISKICQFVLLHRAAPTRPQSALPILGERSAPQGPQRTRFRPSMYRDVQRRTVNQAQRGAVQHKPWFGIDSWERKRQKPIDQ